MPVTDFPKKGGDKKVTLRNSEYPQFDHDYASDLRDNWPQIWRLGGNIRGNSAFTNWGKARDGSETPAVLDWIKEREAWAARHLEDFRIAGVVAQIKWGVIGSRGESYMKELVNARKERIEARGCCELQMVKGAAKLRIYGLVGKEKNTAESIIAQIEAVDESADMDVRINTEGGGVSHGMAIYNALRRRAGTVRTYVDGQAASMGSIIFLAGDERYMAPGTSIYLHDVGLATQFADATDMRELADLAEEMSEQLVAIYVDRTGITAGEIRNMMDGDTTIFADEALELGFATAIEDELKMAAVFLPPNGPAATADEPSNPTNGDSVMADTPDPRAELRSYVDEFGAEAGSRYYLEGVSLEAARTGHVAAQLAALKTEAENLKSELATAKAELATRDRELVALKVELEGAKPVKPSDPAPDSPPAAVKVKELHAQLVKGGKTASQAWAEIIRNHPAEYKAQIRKES